MTDKMNKLDEIQEALAALVTTYVAPEWQDNPEIKPTCKDFEDKILGALQHLRENCVIIEKKDYELMLKAMEPLNGMVVSEKPHSCAGTANDYEEGAE